MAFEATPIGIFVQLTRIDRKTAKFILGGLSVFAAAAIVSAWHVNTVTMALVGLYIVGFSLLLIIVRDLSVPLRITLQTFIVVLIIAIATTFFLSCVTTPAWPKPAYA